MGYTNHGPGALNFLISGSVGLLEFRITPAWAALIYHGAGCVGIDCDPAACDAEGLAGEEISLAWRLADFDDAAVWRELAVRYLAWELVGGGEEFPPDAVNTDMIRQLRDTPYDEGGA